MADFHGAEHGLQDEYGFRITMVHSNGGENQGNWVTGFQKTGLNVTAEVQSRLVAQKYSKWFTFFFVYLNRRISGSGLILDFLFASFLVHFCMYLAADLSYCPPFSLFKRHIAGL